MTETDDDATLARRVTTGTDRDAECALYRRLAPRVRAFGRRHLGDPAAADDLAQDVLLAVLANLRAGRVERPERIHAYLLSTCRLTVMDRRRGELRRRELLERAAPWIAAAPEPAGAAPEHDLGRLAECLDRLAPRARSAIVATFFAEEPPQSIAASLGTTLGNVRVIRHRALQALHACLTEAA